MLRKFKIGVFKVFNLRFKVPRPLGLVYPNVVKFYLFDFIPQFEQSIIFGIFPFGKLTCRSRFATRICRYMHQQIQDGEENEDSLLSHKNACKMKFILKSILYKIFCRLKKIKLVLNS